MTTITQVLLPNGRQCFLDANGNPLAGGSVGMYEPATLTPRPTYQDPLGATPNANPVPLDMAGTALIYGFGQYRQIVKDSAGTTIWDALTYGLVPNDGITGGFGLQTAIASAVHVDLGTITTHNALVTGTASIQSFGHSADTSEPIYYVEFDSTAVLVYDAVGMILPGGQNIDMSHGDGVLVEYEGAGNWKVIAWFPAAGYGVNTQVSIASGSLVDLGTIQTHNALITGTTTINSFGGAASLTMPIFRVEFDDVLQLTNDDTALILPGGKNITTAAGDCAEFEFLGSTDWRCRSYSPASGVAAVVNAPLQRVFVFTDDGDFTFNIPDAVKPSTRIKFTVIGPGGGGGSSDGGNVGGGQGGGAGGYYEGVVYGFDNSMNITGHVGANGGTGVAGAKGNDGNAASKLTFNSVDFIVAGLGLGGQKNSGTGAGFGLGGVVTTDFTGLNLEATIQERSDAGVAGEYAGSDVNVSGAGGSTPRGTGGSGRTFASGGTGLGGANGLGYGAAGGGGLIGSKGGDAAGGCVIIELLVQV